MVEGYCNPQLPSHSQSQRFHWRERASLQARLNYRERGRSHFMITRYNGTCLPPRPSPSQRASAPPVISAVRRTYHKSTRHISLSATLCAPPTKAAAGPTIGDLPQKHECVKLSRRLLIAKLA